MSGSHSLSLKMKNQHATQKKSNMGKAQSLLDDENQLRGTERYQMPTNTNSVELGSFQGRGFQTYLIVFTSLVMSDLLVFVNFSLIGGKRM